MCRAISLATFEACLTVGAMKTSLLCVGVLALLVQGSTHLAAQQETVIPAKAGQPTEILVGTKPEPRTKLEAFMARPGTLLVVGYTDVDPAVGRSSTSVSFRYLEYTDSSTSQKTYGLKVTVRNGSDETADKGTSYIDLNEFESIIKGLESLAKIDKSFTKLANFEAHLNTVGGLDISVTGDKDPELCLTSEGVTASFALSDIAKIESIFQDANTTLVGLHDASGKSAP